MDLKALDLFQAYNDNKLPREGGYIVSSFFNTRSKYSKYEVVAYNGVKTIYLTKDGLTFQTDGNKLFILAEPGIFSKKFIEPFRRDSQHQIPHRFSELDIIKASNQTQVMISKKPIITYSSFTILRPTGVNFSLVFYKRDDIYENLSYFFIETLSKEAGVPKSDARKATEKIIKIIKGFTIW